MLSRTQFGTEKKLEIRSCYFKTNNGHFVLFELKHNF
jgi:hypothetical protein